MNPFPRRSRPPAVRLASPAGEAVTGCAGSWRNGRRPVRRGTTASRSPHLMAPPSRRYSARATQRRPRGRSTASGPDPPGAGPSTGMQPTSRLRARGRGRPFASCAAVASDISEVALESVRWISVVAMRHRSNAVPLSHGSGMHTRSGVAAQPVVRHVGGVAGVWSRSRLVVHGWAGLVVGAWGSREGVRACLGGWPGAGGRGKGALWGGGPLLGRCGRP